MSAEAEGALRGAATLREIGANVARVFVGKQAQVQHLLLAFAAGLHVLIEDVPGVGKTTLARALAASVGLDFGRIQFTPDLLPGDITGMTVWSPEKREFLYRQGAVMHQFLLADEINRASPRTQAALLEAMQEGSVSVDGRTYALPEPFFVAATQNPASFLGAFPLPEGELDRFGMCLTLGYPGEEEEIAILERFQDADPLGALKAVAGPGEVLALWRATRRVHASGALKRFVARIAAESRRSPQVTLGWSPRASQHLLRAGQAAALAAGREFLVPEDLLQVASSVLAHRLVLSPEARLEGVSAAQITAKLVGRVPVPTGLSDPRSS